MARLVPDPQVRRPPVREQAPVGQKPLGEPCGQLARGDDVAKSGIDAQVPFKRKR
ncbi:MAG: hypothetical protein IPL59_23990 [Candidatus Competibacteraceae bacterium]|nr:hypothetical protein [Candidatus Competibacteraceae bacterium]